MIHDGVTGTGKSRVCPGSPVVFWTHSRHVNTLPTQNTISHLSSKHLSFPHSTLCDARAMPLRLSMRGEVFTRASPSVKGVKVPERART